MHLSAILTNCIFCKKNVRLITFSNYNQAVCVPSEYIFRELQVLPLYNLVQNRICFMMHNLVDGFLPNIMSEICMVNNELHNHFTRQSHFLYPRKGNNHVYTQIFNHIGHRLWKFTLKEG